MFAPGPQSQQHHGDQRASALIGEQGVLVDAVHETLVRPHAGQQQQFGLDLGEQVEDPQPGGHLGADQVREADHGEADVELQALLADEVELPAQADRRHARVVLMQGPQRAEEERHGDPVPENPLPEQAVDQLFLLLATDHGDSHLGERIGQPLALHPLPAQDDGGRHHDHVQGQQEDRPPGERLDPGGVGNVGALGRSFEEGPIPVAVVDQHAVFGKMRQEFFHPLVLRRGVVEEGGEGGQQLLAHSHGAQSRYDQQHGVHQDQLRAVEGQAATAPHHRQVDEQRSDEEGVQEQTRRIDVQLVQRPVIDQKDARGGHGQ